MSLLLKYVTRNILEKKGRLFLLVFSLMICTVLLIASMGLVNVVIDSYTGNLEESACGKDIGIQSNTDEVFFDESDFETDKLSNIEGELRSFSVINENDEIIHVTLIGKKDYEGTIIDGKSELKKDLECIVSDRVADGKNLKIGSTLKINLNGEKLKFVVKGIAATDNEFYSDTVKQFSVITSYDYMNENMDAKGKYNYMTANIDADDIEEAIDSFNDKNKSVIAKNLVNKDTIDVSMISTVMYVMLAVVCIVCYILIKGVFRLIITERIPVIGTFMSQGASYSKIRSIFLLESIIYAIIGAGLGCVLGEIILFVVNRITSPLAEYGIYSDFKINFLHIIIGIIFAIVISVISAWSPISKIRKFQVKDVILNKVVQGKTKKKANFIIGVILLAVAFVVYFSKGDWVNQISIIAVVAAVAGILMIIPFVVSFIANLLSKLFYNTSVFYLACTNIREESLLSSNISLIVISLSAIMIILSAGSGLKELVVNAFEDLSYDYSVSNIIESNVDQSTTDNLIKKLKELECIDEDSICARTTLQGYVDKVPTAIEAVDVDIYDEFNKYLKLSSEEYADFYEEFRESDENVTIITTSIAKQFAKETGDFIEIEINEKKEKFKIVGEINGGAYISGKFMLINREKLRSEFNVKEATLVTFSVKGELSKAEKEFKSIVSSFGATYTSNAEDMEVNMASNQLVVDILSVFSYLAIIITAMGIFNNISICFQQRKKSFVVLASVGMLDVKRKRLVLAESMICAVMSIGFSLSFAVLLSKLLSNAMKFADIPIGITMDWSLVPGFIVALLIVVYFASLSSMKRSKNMNIVQELKYE